MQLISVIGKHSPPSRADGLAWPDSQMDRYAQNNVCSAARLVPCRLLRCCSSARIPFIRPRVQQEDSFIHDLDPGQPVGLARTDFVELWGLWPVSAEYLLGRQGSRVELNTIREHIDYDISVSQSSGTLDVWCVEVCSSQFIAEDRTPWRCWLFWSLTVLMGYIVRFWIKGWNSEIHVWWIYLNQQSKDQLINYWLENRIILKLFILNT